MTKQITLEQARRLVGFYFSDTHGWQVRSVYGAVNGGIGGGIGGDVNGYIHGDIKGGVFGSIGSNIYGDVDGDINGDVKGSVRGDVVGDVHGKINGQKWAFVETPKDKLQRLITESGNQELMEAFNQLEDN